MQSEPTAPVMVPVSERTRTYRYTSGNRLTLHNVIAVGHGDGFARVQTTDGRCHIVPLAIGPKDAPNRCYAIKVISEQK